MNQTSHAALLAPLLAEEELEGNQLSSIRVGDWKLISANPGNPRGLAPVELYNLAQDPGEEKNLAGAETRRVDDMLAQLESLRARIAAAGQRVIGQRPGPAPAGPEVQRTSRSSVLKVDPSARFVGRTTDASDPRT